MICKLDNLKWTGGKVLWTGQSFTLDQTYGDWRQSANTGHCLYCLRYAHFETYFHSLASRMYQFDTGDLRYYSEHDEINFFNWIQEIPCVSSIERGIIQVEPDDIAQSELIDLLAIFYRYGLPMSSLSHFETAENRVWFRDPRIYWYERVFGDA